MYFNTKTVIFLFFLLTSVSYSNERFVIEGNKRISKNTILDLIDIQKKTPLSNEEINQISKNLFNSNFFKSVDIKKKENKLLINVVENPLINFFYIEGLVNKEQESFIYNGLKLGQNKIFSEFFLNSDIIFIKNYLDTLGYYNSEVTFNLSEPSEGNINLVLKIDRGDRYKVNRIFFIGEKIFSSATLKDVVSSSEHGWWKFLSASSNVNIARVDYDIELLKNFYLDNGYYDVEIISSDLDFLESNKVNIIYSIYAGKKYYFSEYTINDKNNLLSKSNFEDIKAIIENNYNGVYKKKYIAKIEKKINDYLNNKKIEFVKLLINSKSSNNNKINIDFIFTNTERLYVNKINLEGNSITNDEVVRRDLIFAEGDAISNFKVVQSIDNLKSKGIFKDVNIKLEKIKDELVDVNIKVEEQPTGSVSAGVSVGSEGSSIGTQLQEKNLFGKGIIANTSINFGTEKISGSVNYTIPDFNNSGNSISNSLYALSSDYENAGYESKLVGASGSTKYDIYDDLKLNLGLAIDLDDIDTTANASSLYKSREGKYMSYKGFYGLTMDKRNRKFQTTEGFTLGFNQSFALPVSDIPHIDNSLFASFYHPITDKYTFNLKSGLSSISALNDKDVKLSDRKFLSSSKLRGFENLGIGPKDGSDHVGGNHSAYLSLSSTFPNPLPEKWNANSILFLDNGNVWGVDYDSSLDSNKLRTSAGISLEWVSPAGPISFTFSEVLASEPGDKKESFSFNIGGAF